jgi:isopentenyl diphosphate isomerase/L-lactate dehydrogenase-like FMN-dependent dehydrogenase
MGPLGAGGAAGVQKVVQDITAELKGAMAFTCSADINHIDPSVIWEK